MLSFTTSTRGALRAAATAGAVALTLAGASLSSAAPAQAFVHHGGGFHGGGRHLGAHRFGGFAHGRFGGGRFAYGRGRAFGHRGFGRIGYGFRRVGYRYGVRRFVYGFGYPVAAVRYRVCPVGTHPVYGLGCRLNALRYGYGYRRIVRPVIFGYGVQRFTYGHGHRFAHAGFGGHGFRHAGFGHGGHHRRG